MFMSAVQLQLLCHNAIGIHSFCTLGWIGKVGGFIDVAGAVDYPQGEPFLSSFKKLIEALFSPCRGEN